MKKIMTKQNIAKDRYLFLFVALFATRIRCLLFSFAFLGVIQTRAATSEIIDGSSFYALPAKSVDIKVVECPKAYQGFKGVWAGDFQSYDQKTKAFRPFRNRVTYDGRCYANLKTGEIFVVGQRIDTYPEFKGLPSKIDTSMLITGTTAGKDSKPFLRTIDKENGLIEYQKVFEDKPSEMSIWEYQIDQKENQPAMKFRLIDFRNLLNEGRNERLVSISLRIGNQDNPYWEGIVVKGSHVKSEE